ncbi:MAG: amidase [Patulibacter sp.]|nr:amidase [Patulibacter sp.]
MAPLDRALLQRSAVDLAALIWAGEISALELTDTALAAIDDRNDAVNALIDVWADEARAVAATVGPGDPRPFAGVPTAIKNNRAVAGHRLTQGSTFPGDPVPTQDHSVVRRLRDAGFVLLGATNLPEWAIMAVTNPRRFGPTRNPWDPTRTSGGSSGGAAAAVAAGILPVAHGNDGGGSIRIPAACCGLVGLKPQRGRISLAPDLGQHLLASDGMLTRTVIDTAATLDVLAGPELGDASWAPPPATSFTAHAARGVEGRLQRLRIGLVLEPAFEGAPSAADAGVARRVATRLAELGHLVDEIPAPWRREGLLELFASSFLPAIGSSIRAVERRRGRSCRPEDVESLSWMVHEQARSATAVEYVLADAELQAFAREVVVATSAYDVVLTPALAEPPPRVEELDPDGPDPAATFARGGRFNPYLAISNITGSPAISLPLGVHPGPSTEGLPVGVQLIGRPADEGTLLALAAELEQAMPWEGRIAPLAR